MSGTLVSPRQGKYSRVIYRDVNSQFTLDGKPLLLDNIHAVNNEIINLILTQVGERHFEPEFGSRLPNLIFDQPIAFTDWLMEDELFIAVNRWLPNVRIDFNRSTIQAMVGEGGYYFKLIYSVIGLGGNLQVDFHLST